MPHGQDLCLTTNDYGMNATRPHGHEYDQNRTTKRTSSWTIGRELERAGTRAGMSWNGRVLRRELERDASDRGTRAVVVQDAS
ncbi:hypothetical protein DY000_02008954 [Brassica cretica]|uniref:DUF4005 domain-containing protein n=1 Tax=Brassica cretica TaxID=69181 RepID=A0ABQ7CB79_BRACR|nr:hypothetical protein DY000_02008954 [Brassica cretica]